MNRTFKGKITPGMILIFLIFLAITFYFAWIKGFPGLFFLVCDIVILERILHTEYVIHSTGTLLIHKGRFMKDRTIDIQQISRIEKGESFYTKSGIYSYLNLILKDGQIISVWPADESGFLEYIKKKHDQKNAEEEE